ncbi:hypothetical protein CYY_005398 [Polysphondylium violaceum]|uniref:alpha-1,3-mannosyl-glycoprotein 2-beta-N-acetylglucosaminyltransferase n=1 Tax=Polysphondylium violaceum TaxID=133409 RepID=A0A8J4PWN8_9MYCE|nr:hypothetical protein CYY_005398 [Polysphondylium violaceum]
MLNKLNYYNSNLLKHKTNKKKIIITVCLLVAIYYFFFLKTGSSQEIGKNKDKILFQDDEQIQLFTMDDKELFSRKNGWNYDELENVINANIADMNQYNYEEKVSKVVWLDHIRPVNENLLRIKNNGKSKNFQNTNSIQHPDIAIITSNKPEYLERLLYNLLLVSNANVQRIHVFHDGYSEISDILKKYGVNPELHVSQYRHVANLKTQEEKLYYMNSHYKEIFNYVFNNQSMDKVIFLEDDLILSPDALKYFDILSNLMDVDPSIFCISAWNDNAFKFQDDLMKTFQDSRFTFYRQDHFGGLGFLLSHQIYTERIEPIWDKISTEPWDTIIQSAMSPGDQCIYPEMPRSQHAPNIKRNYTSVLDHQNEVDHWGFYKMYSDYENIASNVLDLSNLLYHKYDARLRSKIQNATEIDSFTAIPVLFSSTNDFVIYTKAISNSDSRWDKVINDLGIVGRGNGNIVRGIYKGVVETTYMGRNVVLVGEYSVFNNQTLRKTKPKFAVKDIPMPAAESLSGDPLSNAFYYRLKNDAALDLSIAHRGKSCEEHCTDKKQLCKEADMVLLTQPNAVLLMMEDQCESTEFSDSSSESSYLPFHMNDDTCLIPNDFRYLTCTYKPSAQLFGSRICLCRKISL